MSNTVTITGHCASVSVSGLQNTVTVETADRITASGLNNKVTYQSGSPKISKSGSGNVIEQGWPARHPHLAGRHRRGTDYSGSPDESSRTLTAMPYGKKRTLRLESVLSLFARNASSSVA
ncbi:hypothetical protein YM3MPS_06760 [Mycobacterium pseudoshottsii]|nr:hypothetical protein DL240490_04998 [Mycobacterium marinum]BEH74873.1 hypothetical protein YM3MPS_06760 [Mycobacterium pseudoshottsii]